MLQPADDGKPIRDHLLAAYRQTGLLPKKLRELPELPLHLHFVWSLYCELRAGMAGESLSFVDIQAYCTLTGLQLKGWELKTLMRLNHAFLEVQQKHQQVKH